MGVKKKQQPFTCIGKGHGAPCLPATREDWEHERRKPALIQMCERIKKGDEELKHRLPVWTPHCAEFRNNHRATADALMPLPRLMLDFDEKGHSAEIKEKLLKESPLEVLLIEKSVRDGTHVLVELPEGMKIEKAQQLMKEATGFEPDKAVKDVSRCIYMVPESHTLYVSQKMFETFPSPSKGGGPRLAPSTEKSEGDSPTQEGDGDFKSPTHSSRILAQASDQGRATISAEREAANPPFTPADARTLYIFDACMKEAGLTRDVFTVIGHRHDAVKSILSVGATQLLKKEELLGVLKERMPQNWQDKNIQALVDDFYTKYHTPEDKMTKFQRQTFAKSLKMERSTLGIGNSAEDEVDDEAQDDGQSSMFNVQCKGLPIGLKQSLVGVPPSMQMPVICAVLPIAAAYADQVEVQYCDGQMQHLGLMSIIRGEQASGKSVCKNAVDVWKRQFDEEDALARKREEEWKERKKARKANEKAPEDPKVLIRMVPVTVSCSTLLKRFKNSNGHTLYSFGEELDTLRKTNGAGSWSSKYDIYRLSFDQGEWGQDYNSDQAESGVVKVAYNWTLLGTNGALRKCFRQDNIENGLSSRILVAEMPDSSFSKMPKFGRRSADDEAAIQEAVTRLRSCSGFVDTPRLRKAIERWVEEKRVEAAKDIDRVKDTYRKRAAVIGFRCGVIYRLLEGKESNKCLKFATAMAEYCLREQIAAFGEALGKEYLEAGQECQRYGVNHSVFDRLPPVFSMDDLKALKGNFCTDSGMRTIISRWRCDGWIDKIDKRHWEKKKTLPPPSL